MKPSLAHLPTTLFVRVRLGTILTVRSCSASNADRVVLDVELLKTVLSTVIPSVPLAKRGKRIRISEILVVARAVQIVEEIYSRNAREKMTLFVVEEEKETLQRHLRGLYPCLDQGHRLPRRLYLVLQCIRRLRNLLSLSP